MPEELTPFRPSVVDQSGAPQRGCSLVATWVVSYSIAFLLLLVTAPATSHSNSWTGIVPAFGILMFGAYRLASAGAMYSLVFIFGCGTSFMFALRFISMGRFSLWLQYQAPSTSMLMVMWCAVCLALGASAVAVGCLAKHVNEPGGFSEPRPTKRAS